MTAKTNGRDLKTRMGGDAEPENETDDDRIRPRIPG